MYWEENCVQCSKGKFLHKPTHNQEKQIHHFQYCSLKDVEMLKKWKEVVPTAHRELGPNDKICHVHFTEDDIKKGLKVVVGGKEGLQLSVIPATTHFKCSFSN